MSMVNQLKELAELKSKGMLTEAQFEAAKNKVIGAGKKASSSGAASSGSGSAGKAKATTGKKSKEWDFDGDYD